VLDYLHEKGVDAEGVRIEDGSGLSRGNRVTANFICRYLAAIAREPFFEDFQQTLKPTTETIKMKTGTMDGVKAYAGYIINKQGKVLSFCIISNGHDCSSQDAATKLNQILDKIAALN
jgi:D-alanyl-D-alanine carboxypeptidase/D-alanyl-D-alanine-endopeptidase (penicillin-binding protein 4)